MMAAEREIVVEAYAGDIIGVFDPGLFAIGNVQGDFFGKDYPVHCPGVSHGRCVTFGQLVGEACAKDTTIGELDFA